MPETPFNLELMRLIDEQFVKTPFYGARQMARHLRRLGHCVGRKRIRRLMKNMNLYAVYQEPKTSQPHPKNKIYPYLLQDLEISSPNQVWCSDITYIRMKRGFVYLVVIMDWFSRKVLSWRLSTNLETEFCSEALKESLSAGICPDVFNTDQGSQFTSFDFTGVLKKHNIQISMDGKGRWLDNVFVERLWRSLKYECVYLEEFETVNSARRHISSWINFYNTERPHSSLSGQTPEEVHNLHQTTSSQISKKKMLRAN